LGNDLIKGDCRVIYFVQEDIIPGNRTQYLPGRIRECQNHLLSRTGLTSEQKKDVKDKIWVGHNTEMFKLD
jgi:hypothetical protein